MTSKEVIAEHIKQLEEAMIENMQARKVEALAKARSQKAHYRLSQLQDKIRNLQYDEEFSPSTVA